MEVVVVGGTRRGRKVQDKAYFIMLRNSQERIDAKGWKWWRREGACNETFGNPGSYGVGDVSPVNVSGRGIRRK
jgi:hypothetical protein